MRDTFNYTISSIVPNILGIIIIISYFYTNKS